MPAVTARSTTEPGVPVTVTAAAESRQVSPPFTDTANADGTLLPAAAARSSATRAFSATSLVGASRSRACPESCQMATCRAPASRAGLLAAPIRSSACDSSQPAARNEGFPRAGSSAALSRFTW